MGRRVRSALETSWVFAYMLLSCSASKFIDPGWQCKQANRAGGAGLLPVTCNKKPVWVLEGLNGVQVHRGSAEGELCWLTAAGLTLSIE